MAADLAPLAVYALMAVAVLLLPWIAAPDAGDTPGAERRLALFVAGGAVVLTLARGGLAVEGAVLLAAASLGRGLLPMAGSLAAALLLAAALWWLRLVGISEGQRAIAALACLGAVLLARRCAFAPADGGRARPAWSLRRELAGVAILFVLALVAGLLTGSINSVARASIAWHHWSAYLSPVHPLLAGGVPFRDFPVQYGMGPTLVLAAACGRDCWSGIYWTTVIANGCLLAVFGWMALVLTRAMDGASRLLVLAGLASAVLVWTGYAVDWLGLVGMPSLGGPRFLPLALLAALILTVEKAGTSTGAGPLARPIALAGHALWFLGLAWSPENAFFASLLWWPWLALRRADGEASRAGKWRALLLGGGLGVAAVIAGYGVLAAAFRLVFGDWAAPADFLVYVIHPPGRRSADLLGAIWLAAAVLLIGVHALARAVDPAARRRLFACLLAALGTFAYFLSRSHDNNVLNLMPWLIFVLLAAQAAWPTGFAAGFLRGGLAGLLALTPAIAWPLWTVRPGAPAVAGLQLGAEGLTARFSPDPGDRLVAPDAAALYDRLSREGAGAVLLLDRQMVMPTADPAAAWTGVNSPANFVPLPPDIVRRYVAAGARRFARPGWAIIANGDAAGWLGVFAAGYDIAGVRRQGDYTAYRLVPKS